MNGRTFIQSLSAKGITLAVNGGRIKVKGPATRVTPELTAAIASRKAELLALLTGTDQPTNEPGIVWTGNGGVMLAKHLQPDHPELCRHYAELVHPPEYITVTGERLHDERSWESWIATAHISHVMIAVVELDDLWRNPPQTTKTKGREMLKTRPTIDGNLPEAEAARIASAEIADATVNNQQDFT